MRRRSARSDKTAPPWRRAPEISEWGPRQTWRGRLTNHNPSRFSLAGDRLSSDIRTPSPPAPNEDSLRLLRSGALFKDGRVGRCLARPAGGARVARASAAGGDAPILVGQIGRPEAT